MALLLSLETSTHHFSCALHRDKQLIAFEECTEQQSTASKLAVVIDKLFKTSNLKTNHLSGVVVASGPGSYTGLRIGVATAKGICYALNIPLIAVNTLHLMAHQFISQQSDRSDEVLFCPMLDARRMEVYCMMTDSKGTVVTATEAKVIDQNSFALELVRRPIYFFGEGSDKCKEAIQHFNARFVSGFKPLASFLGILGQEKFIAQEFENSSEFEPFYLKDFLIKKPISDS